VDIGNSKRRRLFGTPQSLTDKFSAQFYAAFGIHLQKLDGSAANWGCAVNDRANNLKMLLPLRLTWIEEHHDLTAVGFDSGKIGSLMTITSATSPCKIREFVASAMLPGNDVFDVKRPGKFGMVRQTAVFAKASGPLPDLLPKFGRH
jgi:hypothetical protein